MSSIVKQQQSCADGVYVGYFQKIDVECKISAIKKIFKCEQSLKKSCVIGGNKPYFHKKVRCVFCSQDLFQKVAQKMC